MSHVSPDNPQLVQITGKPRVCSECNAPWCEPIPPRYPVTVSGPVEAAVLTIHLPTCLYLRKIREGSPA